MKDVSRWGFGKNIKIVVLTFDFLTFLSCGIFRQFFILCTKSFYRTRIFGAYGPIMFALRVWVGFGAGWRGGPLCENCSFLSIPT